MADKNVFTILLVKEKDSENKKMVVQKYSGTSLMLPFYEGKVLNWWLVEDLSGKADTSDLIETINSTGMFQ